MQPCKYEDRIEIMADDIKEIRKDIRLLLSFRWKVFGSSAAIGVLFTISITMYKLFSS